MIACDAVHGWIGSREPGAATEMGAHLGGCAACAALEVDAQSVVEAWQRDPGPAPDVWESLADRIRAHENPIKVSLCCSYCHDGLPRGEAVYCAACLAPHHADCFSEHGVCCALGCGETSVVRAATAPRSSSGRWRWSVFGLLAAAAGAAAWTASGAASVPEGALAEDASTRVSAPTPDPLITLEALRRTVRGLHEGEVLIVVDEGFGPLRDASPGWGTLDEALEAIVDQVPGARVGRPTEGVVHLQAQTPPQHATHSFWGQDLEVRSALINVAALAHTNIILSPEVRGAVSFELDHVGWDEALQGIAAALGDVDLRVVRESEDLVRIASAESLYQELETRVIVLKHLSPTEANVLRGFAERSARKVAEVAAADYDAVTHSLIVTAPPIVLDELTELFELLERRVEGAAAPRSNTGPGRR